MRGSPRSPEKERPISVITRMISGKFNGAIRNPGSFVMLLWHSVRLRLEVKQIPKTIGKACRNLVFPEIYEVIIFQIMVYDFLGRLISMQTIMSAVKMGLADTLVPVAGVVPEGTHKV